MKRRDFLKSAGVAAATGALVGASSRVPGPRPNILFILVDELRFPSVFPTGVKNVGEFLQRFMPNVHSLWTRGVKFGRHYTAASACTPSRGVLITGLYSQQSWLMLTLTNDPGQRALTPPLNPAYPTYGKLLRRAGYRTPYIGKWHVSFDLEAGLEPYGFEGLISPDPVGFNLQGTVGQEPDFPNDQDIADQAVQSRIAKPAIQIGQELFLFLPANVVQIVVRTGPFKDFKILLLIGRARVIEHNQP